MKVGPLVRKMFGSRERQISEAYRSIYMDIDALVRQMFKWNPTARRILEVGCGEGAVTTRLSAAYPDAYVTAIDITPRVGRLYRGSLNRVRFVRCTVQEIADTAPGDYDFVILSDVLHHVPLESRHGVLQAIRAALAPRGTFVLKEWQRNRALIHWVCYASDRWITGDRISFLTREEMRQQIASCFGEAAIVDEARVEPWWNNLAVLIRP
jgi:2-polyprenyl-3-methyl-5-hydroxy-6-metoxy-1,4-benzoquinol methylase